MTSIFSTSTKQMYKDAMDQVHLYNSKLLLDRRLRMPYIDSQTGLAQQDCHLWVSRVQRCSPVRQGQIYSYPSRRWRVKKRPDFLTRNEKQKPEEESIQEIESNLGHDDSIPVLDTSQSTSTYEYYDEEAFDSEFDSDEEYGKRKKKKSKLIKGRKNQLALKLAGNIKAVSKEDLNLLSAEDRKKPYDCQICGKRYKNQQGLRYHYEHYNHEPELEPAPTTAPIVAPIPVLPPVIPEQQPVVPEQPIINQPSVDVPPPNHVSGAKREKGTPPSKYCDFCLGSAEVNKKNGISEKLISCADCGRSGHPSCLQFNEKLTEQVQKYKWQCIECKCCCVCGTSDNDEQLLFCDDCDRGYHMYCLKPPIAEPPEGSWECQLCNARINGEDISKVAVLPEHMDIVK